MLRDRWRHQSTLPYTRKLFIPRLPSFVHCRVPYKEDVVQILRVSHTAQKWPVAFDR